MTMKRRRRRRRRKRKILVKMRRRKMEEGEDYFKGKSSDHQPPPHPLSPNPPSPPSSPKKPIQARLACEVSWVFHRGHPLICFVTASVCVPHHGILKTSTVMRVLSPPENKNTYRSSSLLWSLNRLEKNNV